MSKNKKTLAFSELKEGEAFEYKGLRYKKVKRRRKGWFGPKYNAAPIHDCDDFIDIATDIIIFLLIFDDNGETDYIYDEVDYVEDDVHIEHDSFVMNTPPAFSEATIHKEAEAEAEVEAVVEQVERVQPTYSEPVSDSYSSSYDSYDSGGSCDSGGCD